MRRKKALFIAYLFPPLGGIGAHRPVKFIKYLHELGWDVDVLTVREGMDYTEDQSLFDDLPPSTTITRAQCLDATHILKVLSKNKQSWLRTPLKSLFNACLIPDFARFWKRDALGKGLPLARQCDVIFSTSAPYTCHLIAQKLHRLTGKPWVADFRDEWTLNPYASYPSAWHRSVCRRMERAVLREADHVITVTTTIQRQFEGLEPSVVGKAVTITNGFDPDLVVPIRESVLPAGERFTISYAGSFYGGIRPDRFFEAMRQALDAGEIEAEDIRIEFAGNTKQFRFDHPGVEFVRHGYLPYPDALRLMCRGHVLLLFVPPSRGEYAFTGKIFDYMATLRPILAMIPGPGELNDLLKECKLAEITEFENVSRIRAVIGMLYKRWKTNPVGYYMDNFSVEDASISRFSRRATARQLAAVFEQALTKSTPEPVIVPAGIH